MTRIRKTPYTAIGIRRLACVRCGQKPSYSSWHICADDNRTRPLCAGCDLELNALVLRWAFGADLEEWVAEVMGRYRLRLIERSGVNLPIG